MNNAHTEFAEPEERPTRQAIMRGLKCRCPACGEGKLFSSYLKVVKACPHCGEDLSHQRADDGPAYVTMLIVCHIAGFMIHGLFSWTNLSSGWVAAIVCGTVIPLCLVMLPSVKGFFVGLQWAKYMHGFGRSSAPQG